MVAFFLLEPGILFLLFFSSLLLLFSSPLKASSPPSTYPHLRPISPPAARPYADGAPVHLNSPKMNSKIVFIINPFSVHHIVHCCSTQSILLHHRKPTATIFFTRSPFLPASIQPPTSPLFSSQIHKQICITSPSPAKQIVHSQIHKASTPQSPHHSTASSPLAGAHISSLLDAAQLLHLRPHHGTTIPHGRRHLLLWLSTGADPTAVPPSPQISTAISLSLKQPPSSPFLGDLSGSLWPDLHTRHPSSDLQRCHLHGHLLQIRLDSPLLHSTRRLHFVPRQTPRSATAPPLWPDRPLPQHSSQGNFSTSKQSSNSSSSPAQ